MMRQFNLLVLILFALWSAPAVAEEGRAGFLRTEALRYQNANVFLRIVADVPAMPATVVDWRAPEWVTFAGVAATVGTMMAPLNPPIDVRLDDWVVREVDPWMPDLWSMKFQIPLWITLAGGSFGTWGVAAFLGKTDIAESMSLMAESVAVTQIYGLTLKLLIGREDGGRIRGFPESLNQFPRGTPGGHFGTFYSMWGALEAYWQPHWGVRIGMHTLLAFGAVTHFLNHRHYLSDQIFGASLGYAISQWVVHNRSSKYRYDGGRAIRITVIPTAGGVGVAGTF